MQLTTIPAITVTRSLSLSSLFSSALPVFTAEGFEKAKTAFLVDFEKTCGTKPSLENATDSVSKIAKLKDIINTVVLKPNEIVVTPTIKITKIDSTPDKAFLIKKIRDNASIPTHSALSERKGEVVERYAFTAMLGYNNYQEVDATLQVFVGNLDKLSGVGANLEITMTSLEEAAIKEFPKHTNLLKAYFQILRSVVSHTETDATTRAKSIHAEVAKMFPNVKAPEIDAQIYSALELFTALNKKYLGVLNLNQAIVWKSAQKKVSADELEKQVTDFLARPDLNKTLSTVEITDAQTKEILFRFWQLGAHYSADVVKPAVVTTAVSPVVVAASAAKVSPTTPKTATVSVTVAASSVPAPKTATPKSQKKSEKPEVKETKPTKV